MSRGNHERLVYRLSEMLIKLNRGEKLCPKSLAEEFGVNLRTIQRDLNLRFAYLPLEKEHGYYHLNRAFLGKLNSQDIKQFASLAGVRGLFPSFSDDFLRDIFDHRVESAFLVKGHHYEDIAGKSKLFNALKDAIVHTVKIDFNYHKQDGDKRYTGIEPYKLMNHKGIWYLAAKDHGKLKTFSFSKISRISVGNEKFSPDPTVDKQLLEEDGIWFGSDTTEVIMTVGNEAAPFFKRRKLIANQCIEKELEDGSLIISTRVGHVNQVLPIVKYWIPHIRIIGPAGLQQELNDELSSYASL